MGNEPGQNGQIERYLPDVREMDLEKAAHRALELQAKSTRVVGWYGHTYGDHRANGMKTVRGPFNRWFALQEGQDNDRHGKSQGCLAPAENDIEYAAFALCNMASLAEGYLTLRAELSSMRARLEGAKSALEWYAQERYTVSSIGEPDRFGNYQTRTEPEKHDTTRAREALALLAEGKGEAHE